MIPAKIEDVFIQLTTDYSGVVKTILGGKFVRQEFYINQTIFEVCPYLEGTLEVLPLKESFLLEAMVITSKNQEYNVDIELFKDDEFIEILIHNRTNVYKIVSQLNQNRNDIFFIKRQLAEKNKELEKLRKIADKANAEKSRFLAMMSHEIRNPLNAILGYAELISSEKLSLNVQQHIANLSSAGKNLKVIVDDILDLSRIEAGKMALISEQISIKKILQNCENDFKHQRKNKEVDLIFKISEDIPEFLLGDSVRIHQILSNLIGNAIKFTEKGKVEVVADVLSASEKEVKILYKVADTGRGMTTEQAASIFEEYRQNKLKDSRLKGGAGLGLAIVNRLVNAMKGEISVASELNVGTTFTVELPLERIKSNDAILQPTKTIKSNTLVGKKILVADDDVLNQTIVKHFLEKENAIVTLVKDGLEALQEIENNTFNAILLDINMPNMTGEELIQKIDAFQKMNSKTPVLALTANTTEKDVERYLSLGFSEVISKPFTSAQIVEKLGLFL